ncbi:centriole and centriolar satellite protein OFD1-like [Oryctolagus cuniculus]|uniref:centriole and centriolar satellite protein OFD1-like n=1 Tax=Oryctolagus cuniculus TaxID=9986 RepID=UPI00387A2643
MAASFFFSIIHHVKRPPRSRPRQVLTERDVLQLVGIRPPSGLHASLVSAADRDAGAAEKLRLIDDAFADAKSRHPKTASLDAKLSDYKRDLEEQLRAEMRQRLEYLRETEIARVKMEERRRREEAELTRRADAFEL